MTVAQSTEDDGVTEARPSPLVRMTGITKAFPGVLALSDVSLELRPGTIHALAGENGSGKSTLAKILYGALRPDSGRIECNGEAVSFLSPGHALKHGIVAISQELTLAPTLSVTENVLMGRLPRTRVGRVDWTAARRAARAALHQLGVEVDESRRAADLSVELQQQVEIVRAVSANSRVLILDEATSSLSEAAAERLLATLRQLSGRGVAVLFISHRLRELYACSDQATVLRDGREVGVFPLPGTPETELVTSMVGRPLADLFGKRRLARGAPIVQVAELRTANNRVRGVSFDVRAGEIVGVAGLVGSGKAELALALGGAVPFQGRVLIAGSQVKLDSPRRALDEGVVFVPDDRKRSALLPTRSVRHNLSVSWLRRLGRYGVLNSRAERTMVSETVARFAIRTSSPASKITQLSGGNQQKVVLGRAFALDPRVVVLSEPTRGIDVGAKSDVYRLIQEMAQQGAGIVLVSSELPELRGLCDRILIMFRGQIRGEFDPQFTAEEEIAHVALTGDVVPETVAQ